MPTGSATYRGASQLRTATLPVMAGDLAAWAPVPSHECGDPLVAPPHLPPWESPGGAGGNLADTLGHMLEVEAKVAPSFRRGLSADRAQMWPGLCGQRSG